MTDYEVYKTKAAAAAELEEYLSGGLTHELWRCVSAATMSGLFSWTAATRAASFFARTAKSGRVHAVPRRAVRRGEESGERR